MRFNSLKFATAAAITMAIWYIICVIMVSIAPDTTVRLFGMITHLVNIDELVRAANITFTTGTIGLIQVVVYTFLTTYVFARLYNWLQE